MLPIPWRVMPAGLHRTYGAHHLHFITFSCYHRLPLLRSESALLRLQRVDDKAAGGEAALHASQPGQARPVRTGRGLALEQLSVRPVGRGRTCADQSRLGTDFLSRPGGLKDREKSLHCRKSGSRPCKKRKDGAPSVVVNLAKRRMGHPNNAIRALWVMVSSGNKARRFIPAHAFVPMLNSDKWGDRNKSGLLLAAMVGKRDPNLLSQLRAETLDSLIEMAQWHDPGHADAYRELLGKIAGLRDDHIRELIMPRDHGTLFSVHHRPAAALLVFLP
jgi:hypothetical protein